MGNNVSNSSKPKNVPNTAIVKPEEDEVSVGE